MHKTAIDNNAGTEIRSSKLFYYLYDMYVPESYIPYRVLHWLLIDLDFDPFFTVGGELNSFKCSALEYLHFCL